MRGDAHREQKGFLYSAANAAQFNCSPKPLSYPSKSMVVIGVNGTKWSGIYLHTMWRASPDSLKADGP
jgi:hypothetical protein